MEFHGKTVTELASLLSSMPFFSRVKATSLLRRVPLCADVDEKSLERLADICLLREVPAGEIVCSEGEYDTEVYIVLSGSFAVTMNRDERELKLGTYRWGVPFGKLVETESPRLATVTAEVSSVVLALPDEAVKILEKKNKDISLLFERLHEERAVRFGIMAVPLFQKVPSQEIKAIAQAGSVKSYQRGEDVFHQGDEGDSLHLILDGIAKVSARHEGEERILAYLRRGAYFGEMALIRNEPRMASVSAVSRLSTFQVEKVTFQQLLARYPRLATEVRKVIDERDAENVALESDPDRRERLRFMERLVESSDILVIDLDKCIRCDNCVAACESVRGHARLKRTGERFRRFLMVTACRHCSDPACMLCKKGAITRDLHGEIHIHAHCIGCGFCARSCPYGNISIVEQVDEKTGQLRKQAVKCDLCAHLPYIPCIYNCPTAASRRMKPDELLERR